MANPRSKQSLAVRRIAAHAGVVIELSGTPVKQDMGDAWPAVNMMEKDSWPSRGRFVKRYCQTTDTEYGEKIEGLNPLAEPEFRAVMTGSMRRVAKADVLDQLPPKIYSVRRVEIPPEWRKAYDGMADDMLAELPDGDELPVMATLAQMARLMQLASSAADVAVTEETSELTGLPEKHYEVTLKAPSWKADALLEILAERRGQPVAVFAPSRQLIQITGQACEKAGHRCGYITGTTPRKKRTAAIEAFQGGKLDAILATTGAGGTGITLTAAGTVVFLQRPWALADALQAEDRCHRWGSEIHECIEIIDVVSKDTIDERVRDALREKGQQLSQFVQDARLVKTLLGGIK
jgi:SNF2 family DNA or RNA helicase